MGEKGEGPRRWGERFSSGCVLSEGFRGVRGEGLVQALGERDELDQDPEEKKPAEEEGKTPGEAHPFTA
ncbi:MAG: hypothetical protein ACYTHM_18070 [Planctomycetota bacterium]